MKREKEPLYRKHNKLARGFHDNDPGGDFRHERNTKAMDNFEGTHKSIKKTQGGYDYTPLYRFLLSKVGCDWSEVHSEAVSRLDKEEPIFYMVILNTDENTKKICGMGENSYYSTLTVDENNILVKIDPNAEPYPASCACCTHTFNGKVMNKLGDYAKLMKGDGKRKKRQITIDYNKLMNDKKRLLKEQDNQEHGED